MKTRFVFTVDVETRSKGDSNHDIMGAISGHQEKFGIERIMDLLEAHQARGTFFINAYETARFGDEFIGRAAQLIHSRGHDVELHTHPQPMYRFYGMSKALVEEQVSILERGISLLEGWTGKRVVAHRAGAFAANTNTLRATETVGLLADCSLSAGSRVSVPLVNELGATNLVCRVGKIWEIPVTYYAQVRIGRWSSRRILDIEGCSLPEIKSVTRSAVRQRLPTVCLLMHSFSLSRHGKPNWRVIRRFSALLAWLREQDNIEICTVEQVCRQLDVNEVPRLAPREFNTGFWLTWTRALRSWNDDLKNFLVSVAGITFLATVAFVVVYFGFAILKH